MISTLKTQNQQCNTPSPTLNMKNLIGRKKLNITKNFVRIKNNPLRKSSVQFRQYTNYDLYPSVPLLNHSYRLNYRSCNTHAEIIETPRYNLIS